MSPAQKVIKYFSMAFAIALMVGILTGIAAAVSGISMGAHWDEDANYIDLTLEFDEVNNLDINNYSGNLYIRPGDVSKVTVIATNIPDTTTIETKGNQTLTIENDDGIFGLFSIVGITHEERSEIVIVVPEGFSVDKAKFDNHSGNMKLSGIRTEKLEISGGSGSITGSNLSASKTDISVGSGQLELSYVSLRNGELDGGSGSIRITDSDLANIDFTPGSGSLNVEGSLTGENSIDGHSGSITFELSNRMESYDLKLDAGSGGIWINGEKRNDEDYYGKDAKNIIKIESGSGKVVINFTE